MVHAPGFQQLNFWLYLTSFQNGFFRFQTIIEEAPLPFFGGGGDGGGVGVGILFL